MDKYLRNLRLPEWRRRNSALPRDADCFAAPWGHIPWRLLYYEGEDGSLRVLEVVRHDDYERLLRRGLRRDGYPLSGFVRWPG